MPSGPVKLHAIDANCALNDDYAFFATLAAFFLLLLIMTRDKNDPTTAQPKRIRMTGIRMAQTRGGKSECRG
jgi:hypothetical protein